MYRVGFGDCFLMSLPGADGPEHVLIDCGVHPRGDIAKLESAVDNIAEETGGRLALIVATHAHQDHISGFAACERTFRRFRVREVWLPWTENPNDLTALNLRQKHAALTHALVQHFQVRPAAPAVRGAVDAALVNLSANHRALEVLRKGLRGASVKYLAAGKQIDNAGGIGGLSARILGPPRDEKFLARMDPPAGERFLRAAAGHVEAVNEVLPFDGKWLVKAAASPYYQAIDESYKNKLAVAALDPSGIAFALDRVVNNTSVVALFTFEEKLLLFPGDAQYGSWESWLRGPDNSTLLLELDFLKIAHHGSENATPKSLLGKLSDKGLAAMVSTQCEPWPSIPLPKLMGALQTKCAGLVRSDSIVVKGAPKGPRLAKLPKGFRQGPFWFDYFLPV
jgi:hypothetical protein